MSCILDTLYGIGLKNKIKEWSINVIDKNSYSLVVYSYCYLNSSKVECTKIIYSNQDHYQIAVLYAQQKWKDKVENGYNTDIEIIKNKIPILNSKPSVTFY